MDIKSILKQRISAANLLARRRREKMRRRLINTTATFLCPNCIGGILFHDLGLQFRSPTVNLMMMQPDFVKFVLDLDHYLSCELRFYQDPEYDCPCAYLDDIVLHFTHYHSEQEAAEKWEQRKTRIDRSNLFVFLTERDALTEAQIRSLRQLQARGILVFTAHAYPEIPYALEIPKYRAAGEVGNILQKHGLSEMREYEQYFDFVKWFNEADGGSYDISPYLLKTK